LTAHSNSENALAAQQTGVPHISRFEMWDEQMLAVHDPESTFH
jgi:hypothetical protein